jgi:hypothetical protein
MAPWIKLSLMEFWLPYYYSFRKPCPGGRDFLWLSVFLALILTLILLLIASHEGILNRLVDVFLGNIKNHGIPISVTNNYMTNGGRDGIDSSVLSEIKKREGMEVHPYRSLTPDMKPYIDLIDSKIWKNKIHKFNGWAVYDDDPVIGKHTFSEGLPFEIIMNRTFVSKNFNYDFYRTILQTKLPPELFEKIPHFMKTDKKPFEKIWLNVKNTSTGELFPFTVKWVERFPVIDKIAYVLPLKTYFALEAARMFPELRYFPEANGESRERVTKIRVVVLKRQNDDSSVLSDFDGQLHSELPIKQIVMNRGDVIIEFLHPLRKIWIDFFCSKQNMAYKVFGTESGDKISFQNGLLSLPCSRLPSAYRMISNCSGEGITPRFANLDVTAKGRGFLNATIYVNDRNQLFNAVHTLKKIKENALSLHPAYEDSLNRLGFLNKMLEMMTMPYIIFLLIFTLLILFIWIATLIGHHRHRYGIFLAKGMKWNEIYYLFGLQIFIATLIGFIFSAFVMQVAKLYLIDMMGPVGMEFKDILTFSDLNLLPLFITDYVYAFVFVLLYAWVIAWGLLWHMPLRPRTQPASLL